MMAQKDNPKLTITLTGRPPVKITKADWPILARAIDSWHDGEVESQADRESSGSITVRQHPDRRAIVYGAYSYSTRYRNERSKDVRGGEMLEPSNSAAIVGAVQRVGVWMSEHSPADENVDFERLANECIADMPAEEL